MAVLNAASPTPHHNLLYLPRHFHQKKQAPPLFQSFQSWFFYRDGQHSPERSRLRDLVSEVWTGTNELVGVVRVVMQIVDHTHNLKVVR